MEFIKKHMSNGWVKEGGKLARRTILEYDFMERRGSGIKKILLAYENDEKKPKFEIMK